MSQTFKLIYLAYLHISIKEYIQHGTLLSMGMLNCKTKTKSIKHFKKALAIIRKYNFQKLK